MRFFQVVASGAALIAAALALEINQFPAGGVKAGTTYTITYSPKSDTPTTFILRKGVSTDLGTVGTLTTTATGGSFSWTVADDLVNGADYALEIRQEGQAPNYSAQFGLTGGETASASSAIASAVSSAVSSVRSSASSAASASSASASLSSLISSVASSAAASATASMSAGMNSTISTATLSRSASGSATGSATATGSASSTNTAGGPPESTGAASMLGSSPMALLFGAVGAFAFLG